MKILIAPALACLLHVWQATSQHIQSDPGVAGPSLEIAHLYYDQFPTGIAITSAGRRFSTYPSSLFGKNINNYTVAELTSNNTEVPYPNLAINTPPGGRVNHSTSPATAANYKDYLISVQGIVVDARDRLWLLDNGRVIDESGSQLNAAGNGPKIIGINTTTNQVFQTITFPTTVVFPDSYLNDFRIDLRKNQSQSGQGVAYITDSSSQHSGIVIVDLGTGESWSHLRGAGQTRATQQHLVQVWGDTVYFLTGPKQPFGYDSTGADGLGLSADGEYLYWSVTGSRELFRVPTQRLLDRSENSEVLAQAFIHSLGEKGDSDGIDTDNHDFVYVSSFGANAINIYNPSNASVQTFVRDPRIGWTDAVLAAPDGYLYFTENQLWRTPTYYPTGEDRTVKPYVLFRVPLPNAAKGVQLH